MVPDGWREEKLGTLFDFKNGANTEAANYGSGIKFVNVMDVFGNQFITEDKIRERVNLPDDKVQLFLLNKGDVLFNRTSEVFDEIALTSVYMDNSPAIFGGFVIRARPKIDVLDLGFCIYCFSSYRVRKESIRRGQGVIRSNIGQKDLQHVPLLVPPLIEQQKIAKILSTWDRAIEVAGKLISNSQQQKKALMQQLLTGKKRLPGFSGGWERKVLSEVAKIVMGSSPKSESYNHHKKGLPLLQGNADIKHRLSAPRAYTSQITKECFVDDILLSVRAPVGEVSRSIHHACIGRGIAAIKAREETSQDYLYQWLLYFEPKWARFSQGSTFEAVNSNDIKTLHIEAPQKEEQQKIASVLSSADKETETLQQKLTHLKQEKKALMQQLLTGKRRVKVEIAAA